MYKTEWTHCFRCCGRCGVCCWVDCCFIYLEYEESRKENSWTTEKCKLAHAIWIHIALGPTNYKQTLYLLIQLSTLKMKKKLVEDCDKFLGRCLHVHTKFVPFSSINKFKHFSIATIHTFPFGIFAHIVCCQKTVLPYTYRYLLLGLMLTILLSQVII